MNRERLMVPSLNAISTLLHTLKQCLAAEPEVVAGPPGGASLTEQLLQVRLQEDYFSHIFIYLLHILNNKCVVIRIEKWSTIR